MEGQWKLLNLTDSHLRLSGHYPALLVVHEDRPVSLQAFPMPLHHKDMNIAHMEVGRKEKGEMALMVIEVDQMINDELINELESLPHVTQVSTLAN